MFPLFTGINHPELKWRTLQTEHFRVHYHQGLEETARQCADVAEQVYGPVTQQMGVEPRHRTELAITDADAVVNGFALERRISIWVNQNDYIRHFSQDQEWLQQVIAHEFQHVVTFEATRDWLGQLGRGLSGTPAWWYEGLAEYYTERWNTLRADRTLRRETLDGRLKQSDPHNAGYAKVLYLAWRNGDSTLVKISRWRHPKLRLHRFDEAFKAVVGQSVKAFDAEWTRVMAGIYNAELVAGEDLPEIGRRVRLPLNRVSWLALLPDSSAWIAVGRDSLVDASASLFHIACDSTRRQSTLVDGNLRGNAALSADGRRVVFDCNMHGKHDALGMDLWSWDLSTKHLERLTHDNRSQDPALAADGSLAWLNTLGSHHRLMLQEPGMEPRVLWDPGPGWELMHPSFAPDSRQLVVATDDPQSRKQLCVVDCASGRTRTLEALAPDERDPLWVEDSLIVSTGFLQHRANLQARSPWGRARQFTDSGEGVWAAGLWRGQAGIRVIALALDSAQFSRPVMVDPRREAPAMQVAAHPRYTAWRVQMPALQVPKWRQDEHASIQWDRTYRPYELKPVTMLALPLPDGAMGLGVFADPLGQHLVTAVAGVYHGKEPLLDMTWMIHRLSWDITLTGGYHNRYELFLVDGKAEESMSSHGGAFASRRYHFNPRPHATMFLGTGLLLKDATRVGGQADSTRAFSFQDSRTGLLTFVAEWRESASLTDGSWWPKNGYALRLHGELARPWIHGDEQVDSWGAAAWWMRRVQAADLLLLRAQVDGLSGQRNTWRALGFTPDPLLGAYYGLPGSPVSRVRALGRELLGDCVAQGTVELRHSLGQPELFRVLSIRSGRLNLAPFLDWGRVADRGRFTTEEAEWLWTTGLEAQVELQVDEALQVGVALGLGSEGTDWLKEEARHSRQWYWGLHLSRPF